MNWNTRNRATSYLRSSLWIIPIVAVILEQIAAGIIRVLDARLSLRGAEIGLDGAKALCGAVITFALSFIVFTFGSLLVAIQVASGQYTPRIIATTLLRDNVIRYTVGGFVFTLLFAIQALNRIEANVPQLVLVITGVLGIGCLIAFLFLIDYAARMIVSDAFVVTPGGIGSLLELSLVWQLLQVRHLYNTPLILVGKMWADLVDWAHKAMLIEGSELASEVDFKIPHCVNTIDDALALIRENRVAWLAAQANESGTGRHGRA